MIGRSPTAALLVACAALAAAGCDAAPPVPEPLAPPPAADGHAPSRPSVPSAEPEAADDGASRAAGTARPGPGLAGASLDAPQAPAVPDDVAAAIAAAAARCAGGDPEGALQDLEAAEARLGSSAVIHLEAAACLAAAAESARDPDDAVALRQRATGRLDAADAEHPDLPGAAVLRARLLVLAGDAPAARTLLTAHVDRFPADARAQRALGRIAFDAEDWAAADTHLSLAAQLLPDDGRTRLDATSAKQWLAARGGAAYTTYVLRQGYREAARLLPDDDDPLRRMIGLYPDGSPRQLQALDDVIADNPDAVRARVRKAQLLLAASPPDAAAALALVEAAAARAPEAPDVRAAMARALRAAQRVPEAVDAYVSALAVGEDAERLRLSNELDALLHPGDAASGVTPEQRIAACDALVAANPEDGRFGNNAGFWFREEARDYETSLRYYLAAVGAWPEDQDVLNDTGFLYLEHLRDWKERCEPLFLRARRLVEEDGREPTRGYWDALEHLCRYYFEIGRYQDVLVCADLRASPAAKLGGRAYPSASAASYREKAAARLAAR